jgi:sulfatase maturation enzyme AslB (radical SAM superfamily)
MQATEIKVSGQNYLILDTEKHKRIYGKDFNHILNKQTGFAATWGATEAEDPQFSPVGPLLMDIEICDGNTCPQKCAFCYKGNGTGGEGRYMSLDTFKQLMSKTPKTIGQIAFGITSVGANPDFFKIMEYCRQIDIVPNVTISSGDNVTDEQINQLIRLTGAMAVSVYGNTPKEKRYSLINRLNAAGAKQLNIHFMLSKQTISYAYDVIDDYLNGIFNINAIVFLNLKPKNRGQVFDVLPMAEFTDLITFCLNLNVPCGFDSCGAAKFEKVVELSDMKPELKNRLISMSERCESGAFSAYSDVTGKYWHCSFGEDMDIGYGIDLLTINDFMTDVWYSDHMKEWRKKLFALNRECPLYPEIRLDPH